VSTQDAAVRRAKLWRRTWVGSSIALALAWFALR